MTEKRFTLDFDDPRAVWIDDNSNRESYTVINDTLKKKNIQEIVDCLNDLHEEKEIAIDGIKIADELIKKYGSEELKHEWENEVTVKYR